MSVAVNYYLGIPRGKTQNPGNVAIATSASGTASDVEVRIQIDNGTSTTGVTKEDVYLALEVIKQYMLSNGVPGGSTGTDLPKL